ncbi:MAG: Zinc dependent phospholipase, partial [Clostridiales bacterium]|nr:Zinc dependent phospholipase [Clostridiales bacterium]
MTSIVEQTYGSLFKYARSLVNPFKKVVIKTECIIHKYINFQALVILKNDHHLDAYEFFSDYIVSLNEGVVWADQDLKSSGHFYNPSRNKGLYGNTNALTLAEDYYNKALDYWKSSDSEMSMFYLGAAVHLVQDMTVPQHANIKLLEDHRQYENYIKKAYVNSPKFIATQGGYYLDSIAEFIRCNARTSIMIFKRLKDIEDDEKRFYAITKFTLPLAQKTTAG